MPGCEDPNFSNSVCYVCEHDERGAAAVMVNRPLNLKLADILKQMNIEPEKTRLGDVPVLFGGPVQQERGFVLHRPFGQWHSSFHQGKEISLTTSRDILEAIAKNEGPEEVQISLGYSGWGPGQLEQEVAHNLWLIAPYDEKIVFELPYSERRSAAARLIGVDLATLMGEAGHA